MLVEDVLHDKIVIKHIYKKLSLPHLLGLLGQCPVNLMMIGRENSWIINARTSHRQHFVGTRYTIGLTRQTLETRKWNRLHAFALRYASPGSIIKVFCLHRKDGDLKPVCDFEKKGHVPYQAPGCTKHGGNGIILPPFIQNPIDKVRLDSNGLRGWSEAQIDITRALGARVRCEAHLEENEEMATEDIAVKEDQLAQNSLDISHV